MAALGADSVQCMLLGMTSNQAANMLRLQRNDGSTTYKPLAIAAYQSDFFTYDMVRPPLLQE